MTACTACWWYTHAHKPGCPGEAEVPDGRATHGRVLAAIPDPSTHQGEVMAVRAKFYVAEIRQFATAAVAGYAEPKPLGEVILRAVTRGGDDNAQWASATPSATLTMTVSGEGFLFYRDRLGKDVSLLFDDPES